MKHAIIMLFASLLQVVPAYAGLTLGATRVIYEQGKNEASLMLVSEKNSTPYLVQSWIENVSQKDKFDSFIVTPPLFKLMPGDKNLIRIVVVNKDLPSDRESLFTLNVKAIPAMEQQKDKGRLLVTTQSVIKLIYRPSALSAVLANSAYQNVTARWDSSRIILSNPTPYVINIGEIKVNDKPIKVIGSILPFSNKEIPNKGSPVTKVSIRGINDFGGITDSHNIRL